MNVNEHIWLWNHVFIKIMDVRRTTMSPSELLSGYKLPASAYLYLTKGSARVWLNHDHYYARGYSLFHGGRGVRLDVLAEEELEYYLILYKAVLPLPSRLEVQQRLNAYNPFQDAYRCSLSYPLPILEQVEQMYVVWQRSSPLEQLHVKSLFHQFIVELYKQLQEQGGDALQSDLVDQAIRYMHEHYYDSITLERLANQLRCSAGHLSKLFKEKMNTSPIHYLGEIRVDKVVELLLGTDATLDEIAERVGYPDGHSLSRSFKRYKGLSPGRFKEEQKSKSWSRNEELPLFQRGFAILPQRIMRYIDIENHYQYNRRVNRSMYRSMKLTAMSVFLCMALVLGACSGSSTTNNGSQGATNQTNTQATPQPSDNGQQAENQKTRIISTLKGDVEVPANPQRVVADQYMGQLFKLGIIPVGAREFMLSEAWIEKSGIPKETMDKIENLGGFPMNAEKLIELEPDLIIGSIEENIDQYQKIGTTVFIPYWEGLSTAGPIEKFKRISEVFGKEDVADQWIKEYQAKAAEAREKIKGIIKEGETASVMQVGSKGIYVLAAKGGNYGSNTIYEMLQIPPTEKAINMKEGFENVSLEVLPDYMGDHVFVYINSKEDADQVMKSAIWKGAKAVKNGNVYMYGEFGDEFVMEDPFSLDLQMDTVVKVLLDSKK